MFITLTIPVCKYAPTLGKDPRMQRSPRLLHYEAIVDRRDEPRWRRQEFAFLQSHHLYLYCLHLTSSSSSSSLGQSWPMTSKAKPPFVPPALSLDVLIFLCKHTSRQFIIKYFIITMIRYEQALTISWYQTYPDLFFQLPDQSYPKVKATE